MAIGIALSKKEQALLDKYLTEIERDRTTEITRVERNVLSMKYKSDVIQPARKESAQRRADRKATKVTAHAGELKWGVTRPPRRAATR